MKLNDYSVVADFRLREDSNLESSILLEYGYIFMKDFDIVNTVSFLVEYDKKSFVNAPKSNGNISAIAFLDYLEKTVGETIWPNEDEKLHRKYVNKLFKKTNVIGASWDHNDQDNVLDWIVIPEELKNTDK